MSQRRASVTVLPTPKRLSADAFARQLPSRGLTSSCLEPFYDDIVKLLAPPHNCTQTEVRDFLAKNGVDVSPNTISAFLKRRAAKVQRKAVGTAEEQALTMRVRRAVVTLDSELSDAEICQRNGWEAGTKLVARIEGNKIVLAITAVGESAVLAREISRNDAPCSPVASREMVWCLNKSDWRVLDKF